jgi:eukaryotic-like serine/threonine-protein kinase
MPLSDAALSHLASVTDRPVVSGGRYEILGHLGQGGMGTVYLARDHLLGREVALKAISAPWLDGSGDQLLREAQVLAALEHPGIVPVHDVGRLEDGRAFYTMRRVRGRRLDRVRAEDPPLADLLRTFYRVCEAVAYAHANGILHGDIKPQNIMLGPFGEVLLMDWGVAKVIRDAAGAVGAKDPAVGTRGYMAPEQTEIAGGPVDERTDVFALGAVLSFLLDGRAPAALRAIAVKAMAPQPAARYAAVADLMADTASWMEGRPVSAHAEGMLRRMSRVLYRHRVAATLVAAYVVIRTLLLLLAGV